MRTEEGELEDDDKPEFMLKNEKENIWYYIFFAALSQYISFFFPKPWSKEIFEATKH